MIEMFGSRLTQNSVPASVDVVNGTGGENNNLYFYTPNLASRLIGPVSGGQTNAEVSLHVMRRKQLNKLDSM